MPKTEFTNNKYWFIYKKIIILDKKGRIREDKNNLYADFQSNFYYLLTNLEKEIFKANNLEDKLYLEISKSDIIKSLNYVYKNIKCWEDSYNAKKYEAVIDKYSEIESIISQLELCLVDYEEQFHMNGISYSIFQIGKILSNIVKRGDKNGKWQTNNKSNYLK